VISGTFSLTAPEGGETGESVLAKRRVGTELRRPALCFGRVYDPPAAYLLGLQVAAPDLALNGMARRRGHRGYLRGAQHLITVTGLRSGEQVG
jgi:hypothetical protein